jgi:hypothetical protein
MRTYVTNSKTKSNMKHALAGGPRRISGIGDASSLVSTAESNEDQASDGLSASAAVSRAA